MKVVVYVVYFVIVFCPGTVVVILTPGRVIVDTSVLVSVVVTFLVFVTVIYSVHVVVNLEVEIEVVTYREVSVNLFVIVDGRGQPEVPPLVMVTVCLLQVFDVGGFKVGYPCAEAGSPYAAT